MLNIDNIKVTCCFSGMPPIWKWQRTETWHPRKMHNKAYPTKEEFVPVAKALVQTHPCLKETGLPSGWDGWKNGLRFKMGNYRTKMCQCGWLDVTVSGGKRGRHSTSGDSPKKGIKKPRKGEINFLAGYPEGMEEQNLEWARQVLVNEMMKKKPNGSLVKKEMVMTFALHRKEVVQDSLQSAKWYIDDLLFWQKVRFVCMSLWYSLEMFLCFNCNVDC